MLIIQPSWSFSACSSDLDPAIEALLDPSLFELEAPLPVKKGCFPTETIINLLTPASSPDDNPPLINAVALLQEDVYKKTVGPVTRRSLLDEPALMPDYLSQCDNVGIVDLFFNYSPKVYFTKDSPFLSSYIDLNNQNIINELSNSEFINTDVPSVLGLFSTIKLQQYRAGFFFNYGKKWNHYALQLRIPLYYLLEHFFLTESEIEAIKDNPFFLTDDAAAPVSSEDEVKEFALKHLVSDRFGTGDTRISFLAHIVDNPCHKLWCGLQATLPTAASFKRGLIAGEFDPEAPTPPFNLQHFFDVFNCSPNQALADEVIKRELTDFLVSALDRVSTILINTPLGNGKHFGFGPQLDYRYTYNDYFSTHTYAALEGYTPRSENRFFLIDKNTQNLDRNWRDPAMTGENLALLNTLIVETLFPSGVKTIINPGLKFQFNHAFMYTSKHVDLKLGFDYWLQGKESFSACNLTAPYDLPLLIRKGIRPFAHQGKIFGTIGYYNTLCPGTHWYIKGAFDATLFNSGIGKNYTLSIRLGLEF